jgi:hypothetical protein
MWHAWERRDRHKGFWWDTQKEGDLSGRSIHRWEDDIKWIIKKWDGRVWPNFVWLRMEATGRLF